jgi:hypothetical protein
MEGGRGGGKSLAGLWEALITCLEVPGCNCLILRRTLTGVENVGARLKEQQFRRFGEQQPHRRGRGKKLYSSFYMRQKFHSGFRKF